MKLCNCKVVWNGSNEQISVKKTLFPRTVIKACSTYLLLSRNSSDVAIDLLPLRIPCLSAVAFFTRVLSGRSRVIKDIFSKIRFSSPSREQTMQRAPPSALSSTISRLRSSHGPCSSKAPLLAPGWNHCLERFLDCVTHGLALISPMGVLVLVTRSCGGGSVWVADGGRTFVKSREFDEGTRGRGDYNQCYFIVFDQTLTKV